MKILILIFFGAGLSHLSFARGYGTCNSFRDFQGSCFIQFDGLQRERCEVCAEGQSCFIALNNSREQGLCEAYVENQSCFIATDSSTDRGWCEVLKEGKSCFMALDGAARENCENGRYPRRHVFWAY